MWKVPKVGRRWAAGLVTVGAVIVAIGLVSGACGSDGASDQPESTTAAGIADSGLNGARPETPTPMPDVTLTDTAGEPYSLKTESEGDVTLLFMGYTHCPDECPTAMAQLGVVMRSLPGDVASRVRVVFVTTDPERDTGPVLRAWLDSFDNRFVGLTGSQDEIDALSVTLIGQAPQQEPTGDGGYGVTHAAVVWAFTPDNLAHLVYPLGFANDEIASDITKLVNEGWTGA